MFGNLDANRNEMFLEAINQVLAIWAGEAPYDIEGKYWKISTARTLMADIGQGILAKPLQKPHPPIVVTAVAPFSKGVTEAAARGWDPISANFLMPAVGQEPLAEIRGGLPEGRPAGRPRQLARGQEHLRRRRRQEGARVRDGAQQPLSALLQQPRSTKLKKAGRAEAFKTSRDMPDSDVTLDYVCDKLVIWGSPQKVADELLAFREEVGDFGTLLYAGKDWLDRDLGRRSMVLLAEKVLPVVNSAIGKTRRLG